MLRIAVPNKGSLSETAERMLQEAGYHTRRDSRQLVYEDLRNGVELFYLRPRDIATYVGSGALDVGITGRDLLLDSETAATELEELNFADSTFRFAAKGLSTLEELEGKRIATSYPKLVSDFLAKHRISATTVRLDGAVESAVRLGVADAVADVVSTGATLRAAGLEIFGPPLLHSTAVLIGNENTGPANNKATARLIERLEGVALARKFVMMEYDLESDKLEAATKIASGVEAPTVSPLANPGWVAVKVMVPADDAPFIMDELHDLGAKAIIVVKLHAARM